MDSTVNYLTRSGYKINKNNLKENVHILKKQLSVKPYVSPVFAKPQFVKPYLLYKETENFLYVPKHFGIGRFGEPELEVTQESSDNWDFKGILRESQIEVVNTYLHPSPRDGLICLQTGGGKTVCALYIASQLKVKTLVVVHNTFLKDQWIERIKMFLPNVSIGKIQGEETDTEKDIVIAMLQSISMKDYPKKIFKGFGLTIVDECHHIASEVFSQAFQKITSKHMLGLSATPKRNDGLMYVIEWFMGPILYQSENTDKVDHDIRVEVYEYDTSDIEFNKVLYNNQGVMNVAGMINKLTEFELRTKFICNIITDILTESPQRQLIVMTDRVQHCKDIVKILNREDACYLAKELKADKREEYCRTKKILVATYQLTKEGFDVPSLNTLVMATPRPDIDQIVGRILRVEKSKRTIHPLIVDIVDSTFRRQFQVRNSLYKKREYMIEKMTI
jgi:superfamily II DNA or RNA helicase